MLGRWDKLAVDRNRVLVTRLQYRIDDRVSQCSFQHISLLLLNLSRLNLRITLDRCSKA